MITYIKDNKDNVYAIIISQEPAVEGMHFYTSGDCSLQVGQANYKTGTVVDAHKHNDYVRTIKDTQEVFIMTNGKYRVDFYTDDKEYIKSYILQKGEIIIFLKGSHGFKSIEDVELIEVKQGPYMNDKDKTRFKGIEDSQVVY